MTISRFSLATACLLCTALPLPAQEAETPSGQSVTLYDVVLEAEPSIARFRFLAPEIDPDGVALGHEDVAEDMAHLCATYALPALRDAGQTAEQIVISLSDREVTFGEITPEATQFFEVFVVAEDTCLADDLYDDLYDDL